MMDFNTKFLILIATEITGLLIQMNLNPTLGGFIMGFGIAFDLFYGVEPEK